MTRRTVLAATPFVAAAAGLAFAGRAHAQAAPPAAPALPSFTGPDANPYWNGVNPFVSYPATVGVDSSRGSPVPSGVTVLWGTPAGPGSACGSCSLQPGSSQGRFSCSSRVSTAGRGRRAKARTP